jgi:alkylation response protein AidB-like acyl-CoA dehydrogenase
VTATDDEFRNELRAWLDESVPPAWREPGFWHAMSEEESLELRTDWERRKFDAGWAGIDWPAEYGGRGGTALQRAISEEELALASAPPPVQVQAPILGPSLLLYGTEEQKRRFIRPLLRCDELWCQGFSEPDSGSDLASLRTTAVLDGDDFVLNGQKIWTSFAPICDWIFLLARTDAESTRSRGLSMLFMELSTPGVEVRGIRHMTGRWEFAEVFFNDARVPATNVIGEVNDAWGVINGVLREERQAWVGQYALFRQHLDLLVELARQVDRNGRPASEDPVIRQRLAQAVVDLELLRIHSLDTMARLRRGEATRDAPITRLFGGETHQDLGEIFTDVAGPAWLLDHTDASLGSVDDGILRELQFVFLRSRAETISGGTSQVQRNIIGERVLGLPR